MDWFALATEICHPQVEVVGEEHKPHRKAERPDVSWVVGSCPCCGESMVSNCYYIGGKGYKIVHECWASLGEKPTCSYRRPL